MQPLEYLKNMVYILRINSNTVIGYLKNPFISTILGGNMDLRRFFSPEFYGITNKILE